MTWWAQWAGWFLTPILKGGEQASCSKKGGLAGHYPVYESLFRVKGFASVSCRLALGHVGESSAATVWMKSKMATQQMKGHWLKEAEGESRVTEVEETTGKRDSFSCIQGTVGGTAMKMSPKNRSIHKREHSTSARLESMKPTFNSPSQIRTFQPTFHPHYETPPSSLLQRWGC